MDEEERERTEAELEALAVFCFRRLANLEARFITLCARAQVLGIDCTDLCDPAASQEQAPVRMRLVN